MSDDVNNDNAKASSDDKAPFIEEAYGDRLYAEIAPLEVALDQDPLIYGPKRLQKKIEECRRYLNICQRWYMRISEDLYRVNRGLRTAKQAFSKRMNYMLANDPETRAGRNVRDREAIVISKCAAEHADIEKLEAASKDLEHLLDTVKHKTGELKDVQGRIKDQITLCRDEIGLGARWGTALKGPDLSEARGVNPVFVQQMSDFVGSEGESSITDLEQFVTAELAKSGELVDIVSPLALTPMPTLAEPAVVKSASALVPTVAVTPSVEPISVVNDVSKVPMDLDAALPASSTLREIDDFFADLDLGGSKAALKAQTTTAPAITGVVSEIDLDDLIGTLN